MSNKGLSVFGAILLMTAIAIPVNAAGPAPSKSEKSKEVTAASCADSAKKDPAAPKPQPEAGALCLKEICKMDGGVLYHCIAHVCQDCCRYDTQADCTPDPNCTVNVPPYCSSSANCPPVACKNTCGAHSCGNTVCH